MPAMTAASRHDTASQQMSPHQAPMSALKRLMAQNGFIDRIGENYRRQLAVESAHFPTEVNMGRALEALDEVVQQHCRSQQAKPAERTALTSSLEEMCRVKRVMPGFITEVTGLYKRWTGLSNEWTEVQAFNHLQRMAKATLAAMSH